MKGGKKIKMKWKKGVCEVEKYSDGNKKKKNVFWCTDCNAWMCKKCSKDIVKRVMAMFNREFKKYSI